MPPSFYAWHNEFSFYYEKLYDDDDGIIFIRIKELDVINCMFEHNVIDLNKLTVENSHVFAMINNGSGLCKLTILNIWNTWANDIQGLYHFWTTSEENVVIIDRNQKQILEFNNKNASEIPPLVFNDIFYEVFLPSASSLTFEGFIN